MITSTDSPKDTLIVETTNDFYLLATWASNNQTVTGWKTNAIISIPAWVKITEDFLEEYFENMTISYFMERFLEALLLNQRISWKVVHEWEDIFLIVWMNKCPVNFIYEEEEMRNLEKYWKDQEGQWNTQSDRILFYVDKELIRNTVLPKLEKMSERYNPKKESIDIFTRRSIIGLMLARVFHGSEIRLNAAIDENSSSHKILSKYKNNGDKKKKW